MFDHVYIWTHISKEDPLGWNPILLKRSLYSFLAQFRNTSCRRLQRFWHRQHGQVNDSFICAPRHFERTFGAFNCNYVLYILGCNFAHNVFQEIPLLTSRSIAMAYHGQFVDVGRISTPNTNTLGWKVWTSYAPSTWFHQHWGGIFAYNGQGIFENPRSCVLISCIFTCIQDFNKKMEHGSDIWSCFATHLKDLHERAFHI
jgi:hypothetical protein